MIQQSGPARDIDVPLIPSEPRESFEEQTGIEATGMTESSAPTTESTVDASGNPSLSQTSPASSQTSITPSTSSSTRSRRTRENLTIMPPIHEEEYEESSITGEEVEQASVSDTDSTASRQRSVVSAPSLSDDITPQTSQTFRQPVSSSAAQRATQTITAHISDSRQTPLIDRPARAGQMLAALIASPPLFSYNQPHRMTNCWLESCGSPTMSSDNRTVACPRCNDHSYVRYCSSTHLLLDMREHYIHHCGRRTNLLAVDESTISPVRTSVRQFIGVAQDNHDSVERHRQALYYAYPPESEELTTSIRPLPDYYVFNDADLFDAAGLEVTVSNLYAYRGTGSIAGSVQYNQTDPRKGLFKDLLERLLVLGVSAGREKPAGCRLLFVWIKENLRDQNEWTEGMITRMCLAMQLEFGWRVDEEVRY